MRAYRMSAFWGSSAGKSVCVCAHGHVHIHIGMYASEQSQVWGICELLQTHAVLSSATVWILLFWDHLLFFFLFSSSLLHPLTRGSRGTEGCKSDEAE